MHSGVDGRHCRWTQGTYRRGRRFPFLIAAGVKIVYDFPLYRAFVAQVPVHLRAMSEK